MKINKSIMIAVISSAIFSCFYIYTSRMPEKLIFMSEIMDFIYGIALATIAAYIFYIFQIFIPEKKRRKIVKENFKLNYTLFKRDCISIFLSILYPSYESDLPEQLSSSQEFKKYFKENFARDQNRWHVVLNGLNENSIKKLLVQFEILSKEVDFFINNIGLIDEEVFAFLKRLKIAIYSLKKTSGDYDEIRMLSSFLWELFAGWSFVSGYRKNDIFEEMLDKA